MALMTDTLLLAHVVQGSRFERLLFGIYEGRVYEPASDVEGTAPGGGRQK
jgi:hypothetical protein